MRNRAASAPAMAPVAAYRCVLITMEDLHSRREAWLRLAAEAVEPNPFYEPDALIAAARYIEPGKLRAVAVWHGEDSEQRLAGLFPLQFGSIRQGLVAPLPSLYVNRMFSASSAPLLWAEDPEGVWEAFLRNLARLRRGGSLLLCPRMPLARGAWRTLEAVIERQNLAHVEVSRYERPAVDSTLSYDEYVARYSGSQRKGMRRKLQMLEAEGDVTFHTVTDPGPEAAGAYADFVALEAAGWKGAKGTALGRHDNTAAYGERLFGPAREADGVHYNVLAVSGRAVAVGVALVRQGVLFSAKSTYDESLSKASPGRQLHLNVMRRTLDDKAYARIDSCAGEEHSLSSFWLEREPIGTVLLATRPTVPRLYFESMLLAIRQTRRVREGAKALVKRLRH